MNKINIKIIFVIFFLNIYIGETTANYSYNAYGGGSLRQIYEHSVCKSVRNYNSYTYFIPTKTATEWWRFRNYYPSGFTINRCTYKARNLTGWDQIKHYDSGKRGGHNFYNIFNWTVPPGKIVTSIKLRGRSDDAGYCAMFVKNKIALLSSRGYFISIDINGNPSKKLGNAEKGIGGIPERYIDFSQPIYTGSPASNTYISVNNYNLNSHLKSGDVLQLIGSQNGGPSKEWLNCTFYVKYGEVYY